MKKFTLLFLAIIYIFCCTFALTACNNPNVPGDSSNQSQTSSEQETPNSGTPGTNQHIHNYDKWQTNETAHWKECSGEGDCDAKIVELAPHKIDTQKNICSVCQKEISNPSKANVLLVDGDGKQATNMQTLLTEMEYTSTVVAPTNFPTDLLELTKYSEIILMNVNAKDLPNGCDTILDSYVKDFGGGLFTTGGDYTYSNGNMNGTKFDSMLPVNIVPKNNQTNGIVFVIDASGSMYFDYNGASTDCYFDESSEGFKNTPMYYIKASLRIASRTTFNEKDYVGVMHFGKKSYKVDLPLTPATQASAFSSAVDGIKSITGNSWLKPLQAAAEHLRDTAYQIDNKQIIFITDSSPAELTNAEKNTDFAALTKGFLDNYGISTSVVAVNGNSNIYTELMEKITTAVDQQGNKRFYNCTTPQELLQAISNECMVASKVTKGTSYEVEITSAAENHPVFNGIVTANQSFPLKGIMPNVSQFNGVTVKADGVETLLTVDNQANGSHDVLYAQWTYGKGRVGSFASDLSDWAKEYYTDPEAKLFLKNVIKELLLKQTA